MWLRLRHGDRLYQQPANVLQAQTKSYCSKFSPIIMFQTGINQSPRGLDWTSHRHVPCVHTATSTCISHTHTHTHTHTLKKFNVYYVVIITFLASSAGNVISIYPNPIFFSEVRNNLSKPTGHVMNQQFNIQQLYVLPTLYLCVLYLSENKQWLVLLAA